MSASPVRLSLRNRPELLAAARRLKVTEDDMAKKANVVLTHSLAEQALLRRDVPSATIVHAPWAAPVRKRVTGFQKRTVLAFIGSFPHTPILGVENVAGPHLPSY